MTAWTFLQARASDIDTLVAIDDDASALYKAAGLAIDLAVDDPFVVLERERWSRAAGAGDVWLATDYQAHAVGFSALGTVDGRPYLDQLAVRVAAMGQGIGRSLLEHAWSRTAARGELWLTTYHHLRFNRPFYERAGFAVVPEAECGPELRNILQLQRRCLPEPAQRIAMVRR